MNRTKHAIFLALLTLATAGWVQTATAAPIAPPSPEMPSYRVAIDAFYPLKTIRRIRTWNLHGLFPAGRLTATDLGIWLGFTATWADGEQTQLKRSPGNRTLQNVTSPTHAAGLGPALAVDQPLVCRGPLSLHLEAAGGLLLYTRDFPAGGDTYNFMWRIGPTLRWRQFPEFELGVAWQIMHVSNGQGWGSNDHTNDINPSYDAHGVSLILTLP